jgi:cytochrome c-type biogenesis protein CcmH/NrfF
MISYAVLWFVPLAIALVGGGLEYRRLHGRSKRGATPN